MAQKILLLPLILMCSCLSSTNSPETMTILDEVVLAQQLKETSGLYCSDNGSIFSINDSGNKPHIYEISLNGNIINGQKINTANRDWEAITGDSSSYYIGDIGNNAGKRKTIEIHIVSKDIKEIEEVRSLSISYEGNVITENEYTNHDYDAEALVNVKDKLIMFSKSWKTRITKVFEIDKKQKYQSISPAASIEGLPGIVTGADYDHVNNQFVVVGYNIQLFGHFSSFMAFLDEQYTVIKLLELDDYDQVEGVCVLPSGDILFSQEGSRYSKQKLVTASYPIR